MIIFDDIASFIKHRKAIDGCVLGFVPTMGFLHDGHLSLIQEAKQISDKVCVSIFVNPTQFNDSNDLKNYPRDLQRDLALLEKEKVDFVLVPKYEDIYSDNFRFKVCESDFSKKLCGKYREGHFDGVLTVVLKLFQIVKPEKAFFGEKDFQQLSLIHDMVKAFFLDIEIIPVKTFREIDGLAMSSRNSRLSTEDRSKANLIYKALTCIKTTDEAYRFLKNNGFVVDYVEDIDKRRFVAATLGGIRLIDNISLGLVKES